MRVWVCLLVVAILAASCRGADEGDPADGVVAGGDRTTTAPPPDTMPQPPARPGPLLPEAADAEALDWGDFRQLVGSWELVSFSGEETGPRTARFGYLRENETSLHYDLWWSGSCRQSWGSYTVVDDRIRMRGGGSLFFPDSCRIDEERLAPAEDLDRVSFERFYIELVERLSAEDDVFNGFMNSVESFSQSGAELRLTNTEGDVAVFERQADSPPSDTDGLLTAVPRLHFVDESGFMVLLQEQEASDGVHETEQLNWVAWQESAVDPGWVTATVVSPNSWVNGRPGRDLFAAVELDIPTERACLLADMNTLHGDNPASLRYRPTESGVELLVDEETSTGPETGHTDEIIRALIVDCFDQPVVFGGVEVGKADGVTGEWQTVSVIGAFDDPVVVAGPASLNGDSPGVVEVRNVTDSSFEIRFHEWDYLDGLHPTGETVSYLVAERGTTTLPSGTTVQAGTTDASSVIRSVDFGVSFDATPVLVSTIVR